jgi:hypothetical protein
MMKLRCDAEVLAERCSSVAATELLALCAPCAAHERPTPCTPLTASVDGRDLA